MPARRWTKMIEFCIKIVRGEFFGNFYIGPVNNSTGTIPDWVKDWFFSSWNNCHTNRLWTSIRVILHKKKNWDDFSNGTFNHYHYEQRYDGLAFAIWRDTIFSNGHYMVSFIEGLLAWKVLNWKRRNAPFFLHKESSSKRTRTFPPPLNCWPQHFKPLLCANVQLRGP